MVGPWAPMDDMGRGDDIRIIWECDRCGHAREDYPGYNEGGECSCGGTFYKAGESYRG